MTLSVAERTQNTNMKKYLICIDSDGTAMDTMTIKHQRCFGPLIIPTWKLEDYKEPILERWDEINLFSNLRVINRFSGLQIMLNEINEKYTKIDDLESYNHWCDNTTIFSHAELQNYYENNPSPCIKKVLNWSKEVNKEIAKLKPEDKNAFNGVKEALEYINKYADIAIVSSANKKAVIDEWERCNILQHTNYCMTQEEGTKPECIKQLLALGYENEKVLMLGDSIEDLKAANLNNILYFAIRPKEEVESWKEFKEIVFSNFLEGKYSHK